jgi:DNA-binding transcriptional ArsR family regulator
MLPMTNSTNARRRSVPPPPRASRVSQVVPRPSAELGLEDEDVAAEVEAQLAEQRAELTAKLLAQRAAEKAARAAEQAAAAAAAPQVVDMAQLRILLAGAGVKLVPVAANEDHDTDWTIPENDYSDTERVQVELNALLDLLTVVRVRDVQEHIRRNDGGVMSPSNVRYHMRKLANRGVVKKVEERYRAPGLGYRTRDAWSKDPQALLAVLEGTYGKKKLKQ